MAYFHRFTRKPSFRGNLRQTSSKTGKEGVPKGYTHNWAYRGHWKERKVRPGLWTFRFRATKNTHAKSMGSFPTGTTGGWYIRAKQLIRKTGKGRYQTTMIGTKVPMKFRIPKRRH